MSLAAGDLARGDGFIGEVVGCDGGFVALALYHQHKDERRVIYVAEARVSLVTRERDRPQQASQREAELSRLTDVYVREHRRARDGYSW